MICCCVHNTLSSAVRPQAKRNNVISRCYKSDDEDLRTKE